MKLQGWELGRIGGVGEGNYIRRNEIEIVEIEIEIIK